MVCAWVVLVCCAACFRRAKRDLSNGTCLFALILFTWYKSEIFSQIRVFMVKKNGCRKMFSIRLVYVVSVIVLFYCAKPQ